MDILAAFFLTGLMLNGIRIFIRHLWISLNRFNHSETFLLHSNDINHINSLETVSNESYRSAGDRIRITSSKKTGLTIPTFYRERGVTVHKYPAAEMAA